ncbi:MAG: hypothetical protein ACRYG7_14305 [Janthinobacterium lividum]
MNKGFGDRNTPGQPRNSFPWGGILASLGRLALYLSLLACLWVVLIAIGLALCRRTGNDQLMDVYKPIT